MYNKYYCSIHTPEGVMFRLYPAGLARRMSAFIIDAMMLSVLIVIVNQLAPLFSMFNFKIAFGLIILLDFVIGLAYWLVSEWIWNGRTVGKKLFGLRVVDANGLKLMPQQIAVRNLFRTVDILPVFYAVGSLCCFCDRRARRLGDIAAGTIVIRDIKPEKPDLRGVLPDKYNSLREYPLEAARMRDRTTPEESMLLFEALRRRNHMKPEDRCRVYEELAKHFKEKVKFPQAALDGMSDEKFLVNITNLIYRH
jgi:uncharacterized RDD family membrane protein YckC